MPLQTTFYDKVTANDVAQKYPLGTLRVEGNKKYRYVKTAGAIDANDAVAYTAAFTVNDAFASGQIAAGVCETALSSGYYGWMTVSGNITFSDTVAVGAPVYGTAATGAITGTSTSNSAAIGVVVVANPTAFINLG